MSLRWNHRVKRKPAVTGRGDLSQGTRPKISIVFGVHNPSCAGDLLGRTQTCLLGLIELANRYRLGVEIVIVEWNPHQQHARFREELSWPDWLGSVSLRFLGE